MQTTVFGDATTIDKGQKNIDLIEELKTGVVMEGDGTSFDASKGADVFVIALVMVAQTNELLTEGSWGTGDVNTQELKVGHLLASLQDFCMHGVKKWLGLLLGRNYLFWAFGSLGGLLCARGASGFLLAWFMEKYKVYD